MQVETYVPIIQITNSRTMKESIKRNSNRQCRNTEWDNNYKHEKYPSTHRDEYEMILQDVMINKFLINDPEYSSKRDTCPQHEHEVG